MPANSCVQALLTDDQHHTSINDDNDMRYSICNMGAVAIDPPSGNWHYLVVG